jgi:hypothetical protein
MSSSCADVGYRTQHSGKNLSAARYFSARLNDIPDARDANIISGRDHGQRWILYPRVLPHEIE